MAAAAHLLKLHPTSVAVQPQHLRISRSTTNSAQPPPRHCCQAAASSSEQPQQPQQPVSASSKGSSSTWGSGWSSKKRSSGAPGGSVFGKQKQQEPPGAETQPQLDPQLEASIRMNVERANQTLHEIVQEVLGELLVEEASAYVLGQQEADLQLNQSVRGAVVKRLEWLDSNFLAAVNAYLAVPGVRSSPEMVTLLQAVRDETLQLVSARLPAPVQVLNVALGLSSRAARDGVVQQSLAGGRGDVPGSSLDALGAAAHQLIDDMEDQQVVADRVLLARLVLLREELRALAERQSAQQFWQQQDSAAGVEAEDATTSSGGGQPLFAFHRSNLPARCAAFLKNLLAVQERNKRLGLLNKTFQEDWIAEQQQQQPDQAPEPTAAAPAAGSQQSFSQQRAQTRDTNFGPADQQQQAEAPDIVRPGRLLTTLHAMRQELEVQLVSAGVDSPAGAEALGLLRRLEDIRVEALVALDRVQHARLGDSADAAVFDYELDLAEHDAAVKQQAVL